MSNDYYNHGSVPINRSLAQSALIRTEFDNVAAGFAKLPALSGNAYKPVIVNAAGDALGLAGWKVYGGFNDTSSVAVGTSALALASTGGVWNTAIGAYAMSAGIVSSYSNVAVGYQTLMAVTSGNGNTGLGAGALKALTTGGSNVAVGSGTLYQLATGDGNVAVGGGSMNDRTSGSANIAVGTASLYANVNGDNNTVVGYLACRYFTGSGITAIGYQACNATVTGTRNTAVGYEALLVDTGYGYNTAIGWNALKANTSGGANTAVGSQALGSNTTGDLNVAVGQFAMFNNTTGANNTAVGNSAMGNNDSGSNNTAVGSAAGLNFNTTDNNTAIGVDSGLTAGTETNTTTIGYQAVATTDNQVVLGNANVTQVASEGRLSIGMAAVLDYEAAYGPAGAKSIFNVVEVDSTGGFASAKFSNSASGVFVSLVKGRGTASAGTIVQNGDCLGGMVFYGAASASAIGAAARIDAYVDGTPGAAGDMPGRLMFLVSPDGSATPVEAMRLSNDKTAQFAGNVKGTAGTGTGQPAFIGTLSINTTAVGNVGAGTDDLMTYSLPANSLSANGKGVRVTISGRIANNANSKTLTFMFGAASVNIATRTSVDQAFFAVFHIIRTGSNTQIITGDTHTSVVNFTTTNEGAVVDTTATETDSGAITIKCTGVGVADNDVVQKLMIVEFFN